MKRKREIGFMSERTAEYLLVHRLHVVLSPKVKCLFPLYFSGTREGSSLADPTPDHQLVRCVAIYARRPKILEAGQATVRMKINETLFAAASEGAGFGCPVLAGLPLINGLHQFSLAAGCAWFRINAAPEGNGDSVFTVPLENGRWLQENYGPLITPISEAHFFSQAIQVAHEMPWEVAVDVMQNIKRAGIGEARWFGGGYRPFFAVTAAGLAPDSNKSLHSTPR